MTPGCFPAPCRWRCWSAASTTGPPPRPDYSARAPAPWPGALFIRRSCLRTGSTTGDAHMLNRRQMLFAGAGAAALSSPLLAWAQGAPPMFAPDPSLTGEDAKLDRFLIGEF